MGALQRRWGRKISCDDWYGGRKWQDIVYPGDLSSGERLAFQRKWSGIQRSGRDPEWADRLRVGSLQGVHARSMGLLSVALPALIFTEFSLTFVDFR
jgi:hypothetical protein